MIIYPTIELQDGKCVNLRRGRMEDPVVYSIDPVEAAKRLVAVGAEALQVVDLDGVAQGGRHNGDAACAIMDAVDVPVQVGGGIRSIASLDWWFNHGAARAILGTAAVKDRNFLVEACGRYPGKILVAIDARQGHVVIEGWREKTAFTALELAKSLEKTGAAEIIYTDIDMDDELPEASLAQTSQMGKELSIPVISSGTVKTLDDISTLKYVSNISGAVVGRALFAGKIKLSDALAVANQAPVEAEFI